MRQVVTWLLTFGRKVRAMMRGSYFVSPLKVYSAKAAYKTLATTGDHMAMSGNSLTLPKGDYLINTSVSVDSNGGNAAIEYVQLGIYGANGADSGTGPAAVTSLSGVSVLDTGGPTPGSDDASLLCLVDFASSTSWPNYTNPTGYCVLRLTQSQTIYCVTRIFAGTPANCRAATAMTALRIAL